ncbi:MAG: hypothetical protein JWP15_3198 [Alphaproteobacteria bacterium]|nr:hypothetical protein [Alphaproteobacteria bacterium]
MDVMTGPITRQGMHPAVGHYGFRDQQLRGCTFALHPSPDGVAGGEVTTRNCGGALAQLATADHWQPDGQVGFMLKSGAIPIASLVDAHDHLALKVVRFKKAPLGYVIYRVDAPNLRWPARLALGWWTITFAYDLGEPLHCRLALLKNGRIGDASQCEVPVLAAFAGGYWTADEKGVTLIASDDVRRRMRFNGMGKTLTNKIPRATMAMVHD